MLSTLKVLLSGLSNGSKASANDGAKIESVRSKRSDAENRWRGPKYKSQYWGTEMAFQTLGGLASYRQREMYKEDPSDGMCNKKIIICVTSTSSSSNTATSFLIYNIAFNTFIHVVPVSSV